MTMIAQYKPVGRLDGVTAAAHEAELKALLTGDVHSITIDMSALDYVSSAGLRILLVIAKAARAKGGAVVIASPTPSILEVLRISGLDTILDVRS